MVKKNTLYLVHDFNIGNIIIFTNEKVMEKFLTDACNYDEDFVDDNLEIKEIEVDFDITNIYKLYLFSDTFDGSSYIFNTKGALQNFIKKYGLEFFNNYGYFPKEAIGWVEYGDYEICEFPQEKENNYINPTFDIYL